MSTIENARLLQRWEKAVQHDPRADLTLQEFKWARWSLPELNCFFDEVRAVRWGSNPLPWSFALGVAKAIFVDRRLPYSNGWIDGEALCRACESMGTGILPHPQSVASRTMIRSAVRVREDDFHSSWRSEARMRGPLSLVKTEGDELRIVECYSYRGTTIDVLDCLPTTILPTYLRPGALAAIQYRVFERPWQEPVFIPVEENHSDENLKGISP